MDTATTATAAQAKTAAARAPGQINVLIKAFSVLEAMAEIDAPAPLRDIAAAADLPKGTLFRILQTMLSLGYVGQNPDDGFYHLTSRLSFLGRNARHEDLKLLVSPHMRMLSEQFNETVNLGVLEGSHVYYLSVLEARRNLSWKVETGSRDVYYSTALGRAIVGHLPADQREALLEQTILRSRTARTVMTHQELRQILSEVVTSGIAVDAEENDEGVVCVGGPIFLDGKVIAALSMSIPVSRYSDELEKEIALALQELDLDFHSSRLR